MKNKYQIDHLVIKVPDLAAAMKEHEAQGFTVLLGGEHKRIGSRNALIALMDGSYLELIAYPSPFTKTSLGVTNPSAPLRRALTRVKRGNGLVDWALLPTAIEEALAIAHMRGLTIEGPLPGSRLRPDGLQVSWQFGIPDGHDLPFLCADVTPRTRRVPDGVARQHANGAIGIESIMVVVNDLDTSVARFRALLGVTEKRVFAFKERKTATFTLGAMSITLAMPLDEDTLLYKQLATRGEGPIAYNLRYE